MSQQATQAAKTAYRTFRELHGVVVSAGMMDKTVKVRVGGQKWNSFLKKVGLSLSPSSSHTSSAAFALPSPQTPC
jgi:ribosomal protein S17